MNQATVINNSLYLVTDETVALEKLLDVVKQAITGGVSVVQLREKESTGQMFYQKALALKQLLSSHPVLLIINDRIDVALAIDADGVHIGQDDLPAAQVRKIIPESMILGVSAQTVEQAQDAEKNGADYLGSGAVFPTNTKKDTDHLPLDTLRDIVQSVSIPVVAIGGITTENINKLANSGVSGISVVSAIFQADDPLRAAQLLKNQILNFS
jgi:thiamine-phosphate pyrophosphorylase